MKDESTAPATAPAPPPFPTAPVNAVAKDGSIPGPRMDPSRIGEATRRARKVEADAKAAA